MSENKPATPPAVRAVDRPLQLTLEPPPIENLQKRINIRPDFQFRNPCLRSSEFRPQCLDLP